MFLSALNFIITFWWVYGFLALILILFIGFASMFAMEALKIKLSFKVFAPFTFVFAVLPFLLFIFVDFINPYLLGLGYTTDNFEVVVHEENVLWGMDDWFLSGGGYGSVIVYRIQGIDLDTGKKLFRRSIADYFKAQGNKNELVWVSTGEELADLLGIDLKTGQTKITINEKYLIKNFPELSKGVHKYTYNPKTSLVDVISKDGKTLSMDPEKNTKIDHPVEIEEPEN